MSRVTSPGRGKNEYRVKINGTIELIGTVWANSGKEAIQLMKNEFESWDGLSMGECYFEEIIEDWVDCEYKLDDANAVIIWEKKHDEEDDDDDD